MKYDDLFALHYQVNGRIGKDSGTDCYGYVIELARRNGTPLKDIVYDSDKVPVEELEEFITHLNVQEIPENKAKKGDLVQCEYEGVLHVGMLVDNQTVTHMTYSGPRVSPVIALKNRKYARII